MEVLFFPFSHADQSQRTTLTAFFPRFVFLPLDADLTRSPGMVPLVEKKKAVPVFTPKSRLDEVASRVDAWMNWAEMHRGNEHNLKALLRDTPYLTDHLGPASIQSELRSRMAGKTLYKFEDFPNKPDPLLFSIIAGLTDAQNEAVDQAMAELEKKRTALFSRLRGEAAPENSGKPEPPRRDPGAVMTRERIRAWAACAREAGLFSDQKPVIFVTTSTAVFDLVSANASRVINALDIDGIKVHEDGCDHQAEWWKQLLDLIDGLAAGPPDEGLARKTLGARDDLCTLTGGIQVRILEGPGLETALNLPGRRVRVCRVSLAP